MRLAVLLALLVGVVGVALSHGTHSGEEQRSLQVDSDSRVAFNRQIAMLMGEQYDEQSSQSAAAAAPSANGASSADPAIANSVAAARAAGVKVNDNTIMQVNRNEIELREAQQINDDQAAEERLKKEMQEKQGAMGKTIAEQDVKLNKEEENKRSVLERKKKASIDSIAKFVRRMTHAQEEHTKQVKEQKQRFRQQLQLKESEADRKYDEAKKQLAADEQENKKKIARQQKVLDMLAEDNEKRVRAAKLRDTQEAGQKQVEALKNKKF